MDITSPFAGLSGFTLLSNLTFAVMTVTFDPLRPHAPPLLSATNVSGHVTLPFAIPLDVYAATMDVNVTDAGGNAVAAAMYADQPCAYVALGPRDGTLSVNLPPRPIDILDAERLGDIIGELVREPWVMLGLAGVNSAYASTAVGNISVSDVPLSAMFRIRGMDSFRNSPIVLGAIHIQAASRDWVNGSVPMKLLNPSTVAVSMGRVTLHGYYNGSLVAYVSVSQFALPPGVTVLAAEVNVLRPADAVGRQAVADFLSRYMRGEGSVVTARGFMGSTDVPVLQKPLSELEANCTVPGMTTNLITNGTIEWDWPLIFDLVRACVRALAWCSLAPSRRFARCA